MTCVPVAAVTAAAFVLAGCGAQAPRASGPPAPIPRRTVVWLGAGGVDLAGSAELAARGIDEVVVRRGAVSIAGGVPVLRLEPSPPVSGQVPAAVALRLEGLSTDLDPGLADVIWQGLEADFRGAVPAELVLDLPQTPPGVAGLVGRLAAVSSVPVVPVLLPEQLQDAEAREVVRAARGAMVPAFGLVDRFRSSAVQGDRPLTERLAPIADLGVRVRIGVVLEPDAAPALMRWTDDIGGLLAQQAVEWTIGSGLERSLEFRSLVTWNGRVWSPGEKVTLWWLDAAHLDATLREVSRVFLPEVAGWDLIGLPPPDRALGMSREALLAYLAGDGPEPRIEVRAEREGGRASVTLSNPSPFSSGLSSYGNWVEVAVMGGTLVADDRGDFERIALGTRGRDGSWRRADSGGVTAVRYGHSLVRPGATLRTGTVRLPRRDAPLTVRWQVVLSTGEEVRGSLEVP